MIEPKMFRADVRAFLDASRDEGIACDDFGPIMPPARFDEARAWQQHCYRHGFAGVDWPTEYGGRGFMSEYQMVWSEECALAGLAPYMNLQGFILAGGAILRFGTDEQRKRYLEPTLSADIVWCQLFSEPNAGSDLVSLATRAEPTGDGWVVTGQKIWSSTAQFSQRGILLARTDTGEPGHRGISFFLFDMNGPGVEVRPIRQMTGDTEFCEVFFDEAPIAADDLLGPLNGGWAVATSVLADERAEVGTAAIGLRRRIDRLANDFDEAGPVARDRTAHLAASGSALGHLLTRSGRDPHLGPLNKLGLTELEGDIIEQTVGSLGPRGMVAGGDVEAMLYAPGMRVAGGTSEIQRNLIGERLLGLPREPKPTPLH